LIIYSAQLYKNKTYTKNTQKKGFRKEAFFDVKSLTYARHSAGAILAGSVAVAGALALPAAKHVHTMAPTGLLPAAKATPLAVGTILSVLVAAAETRAE